MTQIHSRSINHHLSHSPNNTYSSPFPRMRCIKVGKTSDTYKSMNLKIRWTTIENPLIVKRAIAFDCERRMPSKQWKDGLLSLHGECALWPEWPDCVFNIWPFSTAMKNLAKSIQIVPKWDKNFAQNQINHKYIAKDFKYSPKLWNFDKSGHTGCVEQRKKCETSNGVSSLYFSLASELLKSSMLHWLQSVQSGHGSTDCWLQLSSLVSPRDQYYKTIFAIIELL